MKYTIIVMFFTFFITNAAATQAHDEEKHSKIQEDTVKAYEVGQMYSYGHTYQMESHNNMPFTKKEKASLETFPTLHPLVVHFPIVLLLLALLTQFAGLFVFRNQFNWITLFLVFGGLVGAYVAGQLVHPHTTGLSETASWVLEQHEDYAGYTLWTALAAFFLKTLSMFLLKKKIWLEVIVLVVLGASAYSVSEASHYGAQLLHIEGVGSQGNYIEQEGTENNHSHNH